MIIEIKFLTDKKKKKEDKQQGAHQGKPLSPLIPRVNRFPSKFCFKNRFLFHDGEGGKSFVLIGF